MNDNYDNYTPSAFPILERGGNGLELTSAGMSLRDYFAAQAMPVLLAQLAEYPVQNWRTGDIALDAYQMADAMLIVRGETLDVRGAA